VGTDDKNLLQKSNKINWKITNMFIFLSNSKSGRKDRPHKNQIYRYLTNYFWCKFTHNFCKLSHFIDVNKFCCIAMERSSLQKECSNLCQKNIIWDRLLHYNTLQICNLRAMDIFIRKQVLSSVSHKHSTEHRQTH
jgi:hypothetical protein